MIYDTIIIGGGPAGVAAGVYCGRKKMKALLITESLGGQSLLSASIENWIGEKKITGTELAKKLEEHVRAQESVEIITNEKVSQLKEEKGVFEVITESSKNFKAKSLIIASGGRRRKLAVKGEAEFEGKGVFYCSICDAPMMQNKRAAVVGGGNAGLEAVIDLLPYAEKIYLLNLAETLKGDPLTQEKILKEPKVKVINKAQTQEIFGKQFVEGLKYKDLSSGEVKELEVEGVFVEIGSVPNSEFAKAIVELNGRGEIIIDHRTGATSKEGVFAAGDVTDEAYKQNNIAVGDAVKAALSAYNYLLELEKRKKD
jgi:alkyl hydroperoxide reductase subunit F